MAQVQLNGFLRNRDDGTTELVIKIPDDVNAEGNGLNCVSFLLPQVVSRNEIGERTIKEVHRGVLRSCVLL